MKVKIVQPKKETKTCLKGHIYTTQASGMVTIDICPICWAEEEGRKR